MGFDFLIEMAWKSALISGAALVLATLLSGRSAGERAALLGTAVALIVALPIVALLLPALPVITSTVHLAPVVATGAGDYAALAAAEPAAAEMAGVLDDPAPLLELLWAGGAALLLVRLLAGLATLRGWTHAGSDIACPAWRGALALELARSGCRRPVRLLVADVPSPLSWGSLRPAILIDPDTARQPEEAEAVIAHEIAHVVRGDWTVLIVSRVAVALFWFNPLMWLLDRRIQSEAEAAADARAIVHVEPAAYAQTLLSCARQQAALRLPASAMADSSLARRVRAILERRLAAGAPEPRNIRGAMILAVLVAAPIAALKPVQAIVRAPQAPGAMPAPPAAAPGAGVLAAPPARLATATPPAPLAPVPANPEDRAAPHPVLLALAVAPPVPPAPPLPPRPPRGAPFVDGDEIARNVAEALAESQAARDEALRDASREIAEASRSASSAAASAAQAARRGMAAGAEGMLRGADGMEAGARQMDAEAVKLGSPAYRQERIARAARQGRPVTERELVEMIPGLRDGARGMREGAAEMRRQAEKMRSGES